MPIDQCPHSFNHLSRVVLPNYMAQMRHEMTRASAMVLFSTRGVGVKTLLKRFAKPADFSGCYVLLDNGNPVYVGISRGVFGRLRQHVTGKTHFDASFAYRIAAATAPHNQNRDAARQAPAFQTHFSNARAYIAGLGVAFIEIINPLELYLFEAYCAMELDTAQWNTFETH